ncbi:MAG: phosphoadenosine phosphosulfate reductase family protein, partial [Deltaproteobacteria bacterium]|nr:phosphoadenosine phosphosulfate reductase family protein [Deltaproteobacteria bacterium]
MTSRIWTEEELKKASDSLEGKPAFDAIRWAVENFHPDMALACSFGSEDVALVDMLAKIKSGARVFYIDTDLNFRETLDVRDALTEKYDIRLERVAPELSLSEMEGRHGKQLWKTDADQCCNIRKVVPLVNKLSTLRAWITGIR